MSSAIKRGSTNTKAVKEIQDFLGINQDGIFGSGTERALIAWQSQHGLVADGIAGRRTLEAMGILDTDTESKSIKTSQGLTILPYHLDKDEYIQGIDSGALSRVVGLFAQRNYNIETLTVAPTEDTSLSRLTLTTSASDVEVEQITKQLNKLIEVVKLADLTDGDHVERELMLLKVKASGAQRAEVKRVADIFRGQIVDVTASTYAIQLSGTTEKLDAFIGALSESAILEVVRTGVTGLSRGEKVLAL